MKIFLLANHWVGWRVAQFLRDQKEDEIVGLALLPPEKQKQVKEIRETVALPDDRIFSAADLRDPAKIEQIRALGADICISCFWATILKPPFLSLFPKGCINFHPGLLPYNRGMNPDVWPLVEGTPAGVTLHFVDDGIDTGDIVAQKKTTIRPVDNDRSLYYRTLRDIVDLFKETWPDFRDGKIVAKKQDDSKATFHMAADRLPLEKLDLDKPTTGRQFLNLLRARTFPPFPSCYFEEDGKKIYVRVQLSYEEDTEWKGGHGRWDYFEPLD